MNDQRACLTNRLMDGSIAIIPWNVCGCPSSPSLYSFPPISDRYSIQFRQHSPGHPCPISTSLILPPLVCPSNHPGISDSLLSYFLFVLDSKDPKWFGIRMVNTLYRQNQSMLIRFWCKSRDNCFFYSSIPSIPLYSDRFESCNEWILSKVWMSKP